MPPEPGPRPQTGDQRTLRFAIDLLSLLPFGEVGARDRRSAGRAMLWAPLVGVLLGAIAALVVLTARNAVERPTSLVPPVLGIATLALLTRGRHLEGLARTVDGLRSLRPGQRTQGLRESATGALGAAYLVLVILGQVAGLDSAIRQHHGTVALVVAAATGRAAAALACTADKPGTAGQPAGFGGLVAGCVSRPAAAVLAVLTVAGAALAGLLDKDTSDRLIESIQVAGAAVLALGAATLLGRFATRRLGGVSGDVLGAVIETASLIVLLVMSAAIKR